MESNKKNMGNWEQMDIDDEAGLRALGIDPALAEQAALAHARVEDALRHKRVPSLKDIELVDQVMKKLPKDVVSPEEQDMQVAAEEAERASLRECAMELQELFSSLPPHFAALDHFAKITPVSKNIRNSFLQEEDVKAMGEMGEKFASFGFPPSELIAVISHMRMLCNRIANPQYGSPHLQKDGSICIPRALAISEIRSSAINPEAFEPICQWFLDVLRLRPTLLEGYTVKVMGVDIVARPIGVKNEK